MNAVRVVEVPDQAIHARVRRETHRRRTTASTSTAGILFVVRRGDGCVRGGAGRAGASLEKLRIVLLFASRISIVTGVLGADAR